MRRMSADDNASLSRPPSCLEVELTGWKPVVDRRAVNVTWAAQAKQNRREYARSGQTQLSAGFWLRVSSPQQPFGQIIIAANVGQPLLTALE